MHVVYFLVRYYPWWALPVALIVGEVGRFFRRRKSSKQIGCWVTSAALLVLVLCWFIFRGDINSDSWVRTLTGA